MKFVSTQVVTERGRERIIRHCTAVGIAQAMIEFGYIDKSIEFAYYQGAILAMKKIVGHLSLEDAIDYAASAMRSEIEFEKQTEYVLARM